MPNILVTGSNGQVGSEIKELSSNYQYKFYFTDKKELDISNLQNVRKYIIENNIDTIINCAAYTAVDKAEDEKELANKINHIAVKNLAMLSNEFGIKLVHISTDYVFDGTNFKPYTEDDATNPQSVYGQSKLDGEKAILEYNLKNSIIIRTSWVYSYYGANFVKTMLRLGKEKESLGVIFDQVGTPTYAKDLAIVILEIIQHSTFNIQNSSTHTVIYNFSNEGVVSWYDFAKEIMKMAKLPCQINPIETYQYPTPAKRPHYSLLNKSKIKKDFGIVIPYWKDGLDDCLKRLGERR
ncbi:MAG: dTDP-4-dehydrorhamnose reductase [Aliarcobacter cryaerophilus]|nr:dTDP-4-dehydrorhamnose reductase [Aliarcobacter cryaerophilus]